MTKVFIDGSSGSGLIDKHAVAFQLCDIPECFDLIQVALKSEISQLRFCLQFIISEAEGSVFLRTDQFLY